MSCVETSDWDDSPARNVAVLVVESLSLVGITFISVSLVLKMTSTQHPSPSGRKRTIPISRFFTILGKSVALFYFVLSLLILLNDALWIYQCRVAYELQINIIVVGLDIIAVSSLMLIYLGRLYYTFKETPYRYPNWIFVVTIFSFVFISIASAIAGVFLWYLDAPDIVYRAFIAVALLNYLILATVVAGLFVRATHKIAKAHLSMADKDTTSPRSQSPTPRAPDGVTAARSSDGVHVDKPTDQGAHESRTDLMRKQRSVSMHSPAMNNNAHLFGLMAKYLILILISDLTTVLLLVWVLVDAAYPPLPQINLMLLSVDCFVNLLTTYLQFKFANKVYLRICGCCHQWLKHLCQIRTVDKLAELESVNSGHGNHLGVKLGGMSPTFSGSRQLSLSHNG